MRHGRWRSVEVAPRLLRLDKQKGGPAPPMRIVLALFMAVHGFAHLVGFAALLRLGTLRDMPYKTTVLAGHFDVGDVGIRVVGIVWLLLAAAFGVSTIGAFANASWWIPASLAVASASLVYCLIGWPDARIGVFVNLILITALVLLPRFGWLR